MIIKKYLCILIIISSVFSVILNNNSSSSIIQNPNYIKSSKIQGYIIEFKDEPLIRFKNQLKMKIKNFLLNFSEKIIQLIIKKSIEEYKNKILNIHKNAVSEIIKILGNIESLKEINLRGFIELFNGISIKNITSEIVKKIENLPYVKKVIPNQMISVNIDESVPLINADDLWYKKDSFKRNITGQGITVAILDTGVDYIHTDLKDNFIQQGSYDFINNDIDPMDDYGHGTHCTGIICGKGNSSNFQYIGVAPDAKYYAIKILDENGEGNFDTFLAGMEKAIDPNDDGDTSDHADIISLSFGTQEPGRPDDEFCRVVDNVVEEGVIVVAAAGNQGPGKNTIASPGCAIQSICVGSTDKQDAIAASSSCGPVEWDGNYMVKPDIVAPGVNIISAKKGGGYIIKSGTSMATPHIAGAVALILQANPDYDLAKIKKVLKENAKNLGYDTNVQGYGRIDVLNILKEEILIIDAPSEINELYWFIVKIKDINGTAVKAFIQITFPNHLPRLRYGSFVLFKAPIILDRKKETIKGKIRIFEINKKYDIIEKEITIINSNNT